MRLASALVSIVSLLQPSVQAKSATGDRVAVILDAGTVRSEYTQFFDALEGQSLDVASLQRLTCQDVVFN